MTEKSIFMSKDNMLTIIVPYYNEEEVLPETVAVLESMISEEQVSSSSKHEQLRCRQGA